MACATQTKVETSSGHHVTDRFLPLLALCAALTAGLVACKQDGLTGVEGGLRFEPTSLEFDPAYADGQVRTKEVLIINEGRATVTVGWRGLAAPFTATLPDSLPPGQTTLAVQWTPTVAGRFSQLLEVLVQEKAAASLPLDASAREIPTCEPSSPCATARFDVATQACVESSAPDGQACDPGTLCLVNATCQGGRCVGDARTCQDDNACTVDVCYPLTGCEFLPAPPCPGDGRCQQGTCDPQVGCTLAPMPDGTSCGEVTSCVAVDVCIEGECVKRDPPDGYVCQEASPCGPERRCIANTCAETGPGSSLLPSWRFDTMEVVDAGLTVPQLHDFVLEPTGELSLGGFFHVGTVLRANSDNPISAPLGSSRRCILWGSRYVCADYPATPNGKVSALDLSTGLTEWTFDIRAARPDFLTTAPTIFLARLVVQGSDRLAALFEAYPRNVGNDTQCRRYFLAVIDAAGQLVQAQQVKDPLLDQCNHPHPYGVAADALGNLFIAFSPTVSPNAPLVPSDTTLMMSYSRDGVFRWKRVTTGLTGGELAVARGLLYLENSSVVLDATSGVARHALPSDVGRAVISHSRVIPAPVAGGRILAGYEAATLQLRWTRPLPGTKQFWSDQLRLAKWQTSRGPRTVALTFVEDPSDGLQPTRTLHAIDVQDGYEAFSCPVEVSGRTPPQLFEVANGSLAVMNGALDAAGNPGCGKCDPPFAGSAAAFFSVPTPTLSIAAEPWVGTFGGAGHDHQEN